MSFKRRSKLDKDFSKQRRIGSMYCAISINSVKPQSVGSKPDKFFLCKIILCQFFCKGDKIPPNNNYNNNNKRKLILFKCDLIACQSNPHVASQTTSKILWEKGSQQNLTKV